MTKVLLCDDDRESVEVLESLLKKRGIQVVRPGSFCRGARPGCLVFSEAIQPKAAEAK